MSRVLSAFESSRMLTSESALRCSCVAASEQFFDRPARLLQVVQGERFVGGDRDAHFASDSSLAALECVWQLI